MAKVDPAAKKKPADDAPPESLDKVRDILFGGQMRTVETRLKGVEEQLRREQESMRAEFSKRVADLDASTRRETQALHERIAAESDARIAALKSLVADMKEAQKAAAAELARVHDRLKAELTQSADHLKQVKVDRAALATLLTDMAAQLGDGPAKGGKGGKG